MEKALVLLVLVVVIFAAVKLRRWLERNAALEDARIKHWHLPDEFWRDLFEKSRGTEVNVYPAYLDEGDSNRIILRVVYPDGAIWYLHFVLAGAEIKLVFRKFWMDKRMGEEETHPAIQNLDAVRQQFLDKMEFFRPATTSA